MNAFKEKLNSKVMQNLRSNPAISEGPPAGLERLSERSESGRGLPRSERGDAFNGLWQLRSHIFGMEEGVEARERGKERNTANCICFKEKVSKQEG